MTTQEKRIAKIRKAVDSENVSLGELSELQDIAATHPQLFADDPLMAEAAGIPEEKWRHWHVPARVRLGYSEESAKHTPGPWEISQNEAGELDICEEGAGDMLADLAKCKNAQANARLIAAAPEMLEALRNVAEIMSGADYSHVKADMVRAICRRAISKAEGRAGE